MQYNFKVTPNTQDRFIDGVSITAAGRIGLPKHFLTKHRIQRERRASLYWDAERQSLAIEFTHEANAAAYPLSFTQRYGGFINAARFFRNQKIKPKDYVGRYPYSVSAGSDVGIATNAKVFIVDLRKQQKSDTGTGRRDD
jgi:predicted type IV restriction endonuclease